MENDRTLPELVEMLTRLISDMENGIIEEMEATGLTIKQFSYIEAIGKLKNPSMSDLAKELGLSKPSITAAIERLSRGGFIKRVHSGEDLRSYRVHLTKKGERIIDIHNAMHRKIADVFTGTLNGRDLKELVSLLNKVVKKLT